MVDSSTSSPTRALQRLAAHRGERQIAPSLLMCDFADLAGEVRKLEAAGATRLHFDCMDGQFVPNLTYGMPIVEAVRRHTELPLEAHLMIAKPERFVDDFAKAGADLILIQVEATDAPRRTLEQIRSHGVAAGLVINPETPVSAIEANLDLCHQVLVMSVHPGFGGQAFEPVALEKLTQLRRLRPELALEVDGGVNETTIAACVAAGADLCVVGSAIFRQPDQAASLRRLTQLANAI